MLDKLFIARNAPRDRFTDEYIPDQAVTSSRLVNENGQNLHVLFPPWHGGGWPYERLIGRLAGRGDAVLAYYFHGEILKPDVEQVLASFQHIRDTVSEELDTARSNHGYSKITMTAMSLGNPALASVTSRFRDFDTAWLVTPASTLASSVWDGARTRHIRAGIEAQGYSLADLEEAWHELAPINHLDALECKEVTILVSANDKVIPTKYQRKLVAAARGAGINPNVQTTWLGHYATVGRFCLIDSPFI